MVFCIENYIDSIGICLFPRGTSFEISPAVAEAMVNYVCKNINGKLVNRIHLGILPYSQLCGIHATG